MFRFFRIKVWFLMENFLLNIYFLCLWAERCILLYFSWALMPDLQDYLEISLLFKPGMMPYICKILIPPVDCFWMVKLFDEFLNDVCIVFCGLWSLPIFGTGSLLQIVAYFPLFYLPWFSVFLVFVNQLHLTSWHGRGLGLYSLLFELLMLACYL